MPDWQSLPELSDEALAARVQQHDVEAFTALYDRHVPVVYGLAVRLR